MKRVGRARFFFCTVALCSAFCTAAWAGGTAPPQKTTSQQPTTLQDPGVPPVADASDLSIEFEANRIEGVRQGRVRAEGAVVVRRAETTVNAEQMQFDQHTHELEAGPETDLQVPGGRLGGGALHFNLNAHTGTLESPRFFLGKRSADATDQPTPAAGNAADPIRHKTQQTDHASTGSTITSSANTAPAHEESAGTGRTDTDKAAGAGIEAGEKLAEDDAFFAGYLGRGGAERLVFDGPNRYRLEQACFTSCAPGHSDWLLRAQRLELDYEGQIGRAYHGTVEFFGLPLFYSPYLNFSLDGSRQSGFLPPLFGATNTGGFNITQPWYWNIAPNYDYTFSPTWYPLRGWLLGNEVRYLEKIAGEPLGGTLNYHVLPQDKITGKERYTLHWAHHQSLGAGWKIDLNYDRVSDDLYFVDYGSRTEVASTQYLPQEVRLSYQGASLRSSLRAQRFQTLQDPNNPVVAPYNRQPQWTLDYTPFFSDYGLLRPSVVAEYVDFRNDTLNNGVRVTVQPRLALELRRPWGFLTPQASLKNIRYQLAGSEETQQVRIPTFSLDSGLYFDREENWFGKTLVQTIEPRLYYVNIPYREQRQNPVFDSGLTEFSFAQMFTENSFSGGDRVNNANQLTAALSSRALDAQDGSEQLRMQIGQRYAFTPQQVTLDTYTDTTPPSLDDTNPGIASSTVLGSFSGQFAHRWWFDLTSEYNVVNNNAAQQSYTLRYQPTANRILAGGYRLDRVNHLEQYNVAALWPLGDRWTLVGRYNWSAGSGRVGGDPLAAGRIPLERLLGFEYDAGCWKFRLVGQSYITGLATSTNGIFAQLELKELGGFGNDPLLVLRNSIPGYHEK